MGTVLLGRLVDVFCIILILQYVDEVQMFYCAQISFNSYTIAKWIRNLDQLGATVEIGCGEGKTEGENVSQLCAKAGLQWVAEERDL